MNCKIAKVTVIILELVSSDSLLFGEIYIFCRSFTKIEYLYAVVVIHRSLESEMVEIVCNNFSTPVIKSCKELSEYELKCTVRYNRLSKELLSSNLESELSISNSLE